MAITQRHSDVPFVQARLIELEEHRENAKRILMSLDKTVV
jgi:hypothetical protein